ncbi:MAG TPA: SPFH domain-containing protein [Steroidobacteraceae bacterium]|nr:SPFH domain-containing protein [Steroidobacteraceae bacterium]
MSDHFEAFLDFLQRALVEPIGRLAAACGRAIHTLGAGAWRRRLRLAIAASAGALAYVLYIHPPLVTVHRSEVLVRTNLFDGASRAYGAGTVLLIPGMHQVRRYPTRDQLFRPAEGARATGPAPFQSNEGLSIGVDLTVRWAIDRSRIGQMSKEYPDDLNDDLVRPAVQGVIYPLLARHSVREIFSSQRQQIQEEIAGELKPKLAALGLVLRGVDMGQVDLPADYRAQMEKLLAEELETEKIRYTLELKEAQVKETQLTAEADKVRRQKAAEAAGAEQVIAARAQEETMKHILPFKQKQIEQRQLEAEAEKLARIRTAEGSAEARRIEAKGEADSRQKLADAEAYRLEIVGKSNAGQMEREGALIARYPLLIQKTLADKLSDKVQVIIAPTPAPGQFLGSNLVGLEAAKGAPGVPIPVSSQAERP